MRLLYVGTVRENGPEYFVRHDCLAALLQGQGLMDIPIVVREIPVYIAGPIMHNWDEDLWCVELRKPEPTTKPIPTTGQ